MRSNFLQEKICSITISLKPEGAELARHGSVEGRGRSGRVKRREGPSKEEYIKRVMVEGGLKGELLPLSIPPYHATRA